MSTEKKTINYNGMKLECIESGYWHDGVTLVLLVVTRKGTLSELKKTINILKLQRTGSTTI